MPRKAATPAKPAHATCGTCRYMALTPAGAHVCYRYPPQGLVVDTPEGRRPVTMRTGVSPDDRACGEHRKA